MPGRGIRLYLDEMVDVEVAAQLRRQGYDVLCCRDVNRHNQAIEDSDQLSFATEQGRAIVTHNVADFVKLDTEWKARSKRHAGIIIVADLPVGVVAQLLRAHLGEVDPNYQEDLLLYL